MVCCKCKKNKSEINKDERMLYVQDDLYICTSCYRDLVIKYKKRPEVAK